VNAERLVTHYQQIADAPEAIGQLRRFILDLAVRGKLVPQDTKDEPASELLKRIVAERARFTKAGTKQRDVIEPLTRDAKRPFDVPASWAWARLGEVAKYGSSVKVNSNKDISDATWVLDLAYSAHCDRRFRPNVTGHSVGSALGGFLTLFGHVASTFGAFSGFFGLRLRGNP
jgi:hypothetical protein